MFLKGLLPWESAGEGKRGALAGQISFDIFEGKSIFLWVFYASSMFLHTHPLPLGLPENFALLMKKVWSSADAYVCYWLFLVGFPGLNSQPLGLVKNSPAVPSTKNVTYLSFWLTFASIDVNMYYKENVLWSLNMNFQQPWIKKANQ